jgi:predicted aspartyl protease
MGHSWVYIEVSSLERKKFIKLKALVDTGAALTALPEKIAEEIGIEPVSEEKVMTGA